MLAAAARCELFRPEVDQAVEAAKERRVHVVVDGERQLPAAFALVRALGAERVTLCGRLVAEQVAALRRVPELAGAEWLSWSPERVIRQRWYAGGSRTTAHQVDRAGGCVNRVVGAAVPAHWAAGPAVAVRWVTGGGCAARERAVGGAAGRGCAWRRSRSTRWPAAVG
ncbi:hypothetical protein GCM10020220_084070 [Nonomuraea rubra]|uniref:hypothetical protein n=1 Tax=Nonomuraea rubra TaxID=46180 RepID=UPI0031ECDEF0